MRYLYSVLYLGLLHVNTLLGYPTGAADRGCDSMVPEHYTSPQTKSAPYTIRPAQTYYTCGQSLSVTLSAESVFRGFLCQARTNVDNYSTTVGMLDFAEYKNVVMKKRCGEGRALTHTENSKKSNVDFVWTASIDHGPVLFVCTIVQDKVTYWVKKTSAPISHSGICIKNQTTSWNPSDDANNQTVGMSITTKTSISNLNELGYTSSSTLPLMTSSSDITNKLSTVKIPINFNFSSRGTAFSIRLYSSLLLSKTIFRTTVAGGGSRTKSKTNTYAIKTPIMATCSVRHIIQPFSLQPLIILAHYLNKSL